MKVLVVGGGGREHAIIKKIKENSEVEKIYALPGLGIHFVNSVSQRDYTTIMGVTIFYATFLLAMVFIVDLFYCLIDPRIKYD